MFRSAVALTLANCLLANTASAAWFSRIDSDGKLVITGVASNPDMTTTSVYVTCAEGALELEVLTVLTAEPNDIPSYKGTKVILGYEDDAFKDKKLGVDGEPVISAGGGLSIRMKLTKQQSTWIAKSISRGSRLDVELIHPDLTRDQGPKKIFGDFYILASFAMEKHCKGLIKE